MTVKESAGKKPGRPKKSVINEMEKSQVNNTYTSPIPDEDGKDKKDVSDIEFDVNMFKKKLDEIDTSIKNDNSLDELGEKIRETLKPIEEMDKEMDEIKKSQENFAKAIEKNPENAEALIKEEIKKAEALKNKVNEMINKYQAPTTLWNGVIYDF